VIVVSDTSPLNYLILIGAVNVLPRLFEEVYAPPEVIAELLHVQAPKPVREWAGVTPPWLRVQGPKSSVQPVAGLGPGELHAIALAK
jgi:predicted nucleic acid-binding protein